MSQIEAHWRSYAPDDVEMNSPPERIPTSERKHLTLAATADLTELSAPRVNYLMGQERQAEREFLRLCEILDIETDASPTERAFTDHLTEDRAGPQVTVSLHGVSEKTKKMLAKRARDLVDTWMEDYWSAKRKAN